MRHAVTLAGLGALFGVALAMSSGCEPSPEPGVRSHSVQPLQLSQQAELTASDGVPDARFGTSVAMSGDTVVIGTPDPASTMVGPGAAYVFVRNGGTWTEQAKLTPSDGQPGDNFGQSVAIDGDTVLVGAYNDDTIAGGNLTDCGSAYVFTRSGTTWTETQKFLANDAVAYTRLGYAIALEGDTAVIGARDAAYLFKKTPTGWAQVHKFVPSPSSHSGIRDVAMSGNVVVMGSPFEDGTLSDTGAVYVYEDAGGVWTETAKLLPTAPATNLQFGAFIASSTNVIAVGNPKAADPYPNAGAVHVYTKGTGGWQPTALIKGNLAGSPEGYKLGQGVALRGDVLIAGGGPAGDGSIIGYVFDGGGWTKQFAFVKPSQNSFGAVLATSMDSVVAGDPSEPDNSYTGAAYVFQLGGASCSVASECTSGHCVDGVCCNTACAAPCDVCSMALGASINGICEPAPKGSTSASCLPYLCGGQDALCPTSCANDGDCAADHHCNASQCVADLAGGSSCTHGAQCTSGHCADDVCCDAACQGPCEACSASKKGSGTDGVCNAVAADTDPDDDCTQSAGYPANCAADGLCDGSGACRSFAKPGTACGPTQCDGIKVTGEICDGLGTCALDAGGTSCAPFLCQGASCTASCSSDGECHVTGFCTSTGVCATKLVNGSSCGRAQECVSGFCIDGVCCNLPCQGQCEACDVSGAEGSCVAVFGAPHGSRPACPTGSETEPCAAATCDGSVTTSCAGLVGAEVSCRQAACVGGKLEPQAYCDGSGACELGAAIDCGAYLCEGSGCLTSCTSDAQCAPSHGCKSGSCVAEATCDGNVLTLPSGAQTDCTPYMCTPTGSCLAVCASAADCVSGHTCSSSGDCVPRSNPEAADGGCGCRAEDAGSSHAGWLLIGAALLLAGRRRHNLRPSLNVGTNNSDGP